MSLRQRAKRFMVALLHSSMVATIVMLVSLGISALLGEPFDIRTLGAVWGSVCGVEMHHAYSCVRQG